MKSRVFRTFVLFTASFIVCMAPSLAFGQWHPDSSQNTLVCDTIGQQSQVQSCTDRANGAILVWQDARAGIPQIYAQHLDSNGRLRWNRNGVKLSTPKIGNPSQTNPIIATDDSGGAYVVWLDTRNVTNGICLFAQHILANGTLAYPDTGLPVAIGLNNCQNPTLCDDGSGGAFVAWEDNRAALTTTRPDIWMNRLWRNTIKYGLTTTGTRGMDTVIKEFINFKFVNVTIFHDPTAHFKTFMVGLNLIIPGKGSFLITAVPSDTQLTLSTYPSVGTYTYAVGNLTGLAIDTMISKQTQPTIINDGHGGCFLTWISHFTNPNAIYGTHLDSTCTAWWDPAPQPGFQIYINTNTTSPSNNVSLNRDGNQLLLSWQLTNPNNNTPVIFAQRMSCNTLTDTAFIWDQAVPVTSGLIQQSNPQVFSDDSMVLGSNGLLIPFIEEEPGFTDYYEIAMVRALGDGTHLLPSGGTFWYFDQKPHMHNDFQSVKITDPANAGSNSGLLSVWDDAWDGTDTMLYAQRMDRDGRKYFPTPGTSNSWGLCISGDGGPTHRWNAKQPTLVARTDGAIVAWTDFRSGTGAIYAQLILNDGAFWIPSDTTPPTLQVQSRSQSDDTSQCNSQCTTVLAEDGGSLISGIGSVVADTMINMQLETTSFTKGDHSVTFTVCAIDSFENGSGMVTVYDTAMNAQSMSFSYCTIADTTHPVITWDSLISPYWLVIHISDKGPWSRGLRSFMISDSSNVKLSGAGVTITGDSTFDDTVSVTDSLLPAQFWIQAGGVDGNSTGIYKFHYVPATQGVASSVADPISIAVFPNPTSGDATVQLNGANAAAVTILDVLGHTVDQFRLEGSHQWQASVLAPGTYIVRAIVGDVVICKRIVRE